MHVDPILVGSLGEASGRSICELRLSAMSIELMPEDVSRGTRLATAVMNCAVTFSFSAATTCCITGYHCCRPLPLQPLSLPVSPAALKLRCYPFLSAATAAASPDTTAVAHCLFSLFHCRCCLLLFTCCLNAIYQFSRTSCIVPLCCYLTLSVLCQFAAAAAMCTVPMQSSPVKAANASPSSTGLWLSGLVFYHSNLPYKMTTSCIISCRNMHFL